jgi:hypothetical protein
MILDQDQETEECHQTLNPDTVRIPIRNIEAPITTLETRRAEILGTTATLATMRGQHTGASVIALAVMSGLITGAPAIALATRRDLNIGALPNALTVMNDRATGAPTMTLAAMRDPSIGAQVTILAAVRIHEPEVHLTAFKENSKSPQRPEPMCHGCGEKGHYIAKCPDAPERCSACKGLYHTIDECPVEIRKTRPVAKKATSRRNRDDKEKDRSRKPKGGFNSSKTSSNHSDSEASDSEN